MEEQEKEEQLKQIVTELPALLVLHAYRKLKSGEDISASEMKVCLEVCKTYSQPEVIEKVNHILDDVPFDVDE
jgi:hypothetical protein|tara:strand:+ start:418 stop:636 length:219 start_codon:yes stop_codon:yes gene_type:complete